MSTYTCTSVKISRFLRFSQNFLLQPPSYFHNCGKFGELLFMNVDEKYGILAIRVKIATSTSCSSEIERISKQENKLVHLRYLGYITAKFHKKIYPVVAEIGLQVSKSTQIRAYTLKLIVFFAILQKFSAATPSNLYGKQSLGVF